MGYIEEYKTLLHRLLQEHKLPEARELFSAFHKTAVRYDAELYYLEAVLCYYEGKYPLALFWVERGMQLDAGYAPLQELFSLLTEGEEQPLFPVDCSFQNRRLRIVIIKGYLESGYQKAVLRETWQNRAIDMLARVMEVRFDDETL